MSFTSASFLPHLLNFCLRLVERTDCPRSCREPVADLAWNPGCDSQSCSPSRDSTQLCPLHRDGPRVEEERPGRCSWSPLQGSVFHFCFSRCRPAIPGQGPIQRPSPLAPPDLGLRLSRTVNGGKQPFRSLIKLPDVVFPRTQQLDSVFPWG